MLIMLATMLLAQGSLADRMATDQALSDCIKLVSDDGLLRQVKPEAFPAHLEKLCGAQREKWAAAKNAADGEDADPEDTFYEGRSRFAAAAAEYARRYSTK